MPTQRNRLVPSPIEDNPVGWESIYPPPPGRVIENVSPEFSPLAPSTYMTAAQKVGRFFNAATGRAKPYTVADLLGLTKAGNEAYDAAAGFVNSTNPIRAYHGSPHTFDRFDMSKIGTGEGAQAYGHGLYFAGNEGVARSYRDALSVSDIRLGGKPLAELNVPPQAERFFKFKASGGQGGPATLADYATDLDRYAKNTEDYVAKLKGTAHAAEREAALKVAAQQREAAAWARAHADLPMTSATNGSMYEVSLRTSPERLLDWDKPLSQQPAAVREAMSNLPGVGKVRGDSGDAAYSSLQNILRLQGRGGAPEAANVLREAGLDGIQYLDAGSRAAGEGSRNYVMFRDDIIDILKRYGLLGMIGGGAATGNRLAPQGEQ